MTNLRDNSIIILALKIKKKEGKIMKRILSIVICIAMLITLLPAMSVFAAEYIGDPVVWKSTEKVSRLLMIPDFSIQAGEA